MDKNISVFAKAIRVVNSIETWEQRSPSRNYLRLAYDNGYINDEEWTMLKDKLENKYLPFAS